MHLYVQYMYVENINTRFHLIYCCLFFLYLSFSVSISIKLLFFNLKLMPKYKTYVHLKVQFFIANYHLIII